MGLTASLRPLSKGEDHLPNGRFDPAGSPLQKHLHGSQHHHRRLLQYQIRRHRSLLQSNQLQPTGGHPLPDRRTYDQRVQSARKALDLPGLRHPGRGLQGCIGNRGDVPQTVAAQTDGHLPQRRDTAQLGRQRPLGKQHPKLDLLPRRHLAAFDYRGRDRPLRTRVAARDQQFVRAAGPSHLLEPLRTDDPAGRAFAAWHQRRFDTDRAAAVQRRNDRPHAVRGPTHGFEIPDFLLRLHGGKKRSLTRQLRLPAARRPHAVPAQPAACGILAAHARRRQDLRQGSLPAVEAARGKRHLFLRPLCLLVHEFLRILVGRLDFVLLRTPLQRIPAGPRTAPQKTQLARSLCFQGSLRHPFSPQRRQSSEYESGHALSGGNVVGRTPLPRNRFRHREHLPSAARGFHLAAHTPPPHPRTVDPDLHGQFQS